MANLTLQEMCKFDDVFLGILQHCGKIEPFLDAIFYFLSRRTDFFCLMHNKDGKLGFPPGVAEKLLIKIFEKHQQVVLKDDPIYQKWKSNKHGKKEETPSVPQASNIVEVSTTTTPTQHKEETIKRGKEETSTKAADSKCHEDLPKDNQPSKQEDPDCFNGGVEERYSWSQSITDVDLKIPVPKTVKSAKDIKIDIRSHSLKVILKNTSPEGSSHLIDGHLSNRVKCEESLWSLVSGSHIALNLEKGEHKWWTSVMEGDREIDKQSIDTTQQVNEFDEQTQADIRKVMYDQHQKMIGMPTSEEQKTHELLKKAWDADGSPFKGTPFDPSKVNIGGGGVT